MRTLLLLAAVFAAPAFAQGSIFPDKATKDAAKKLEPQVLADETRLFLKGKMKGHNKEMRDLTIAVATAKLSEVQRLAQGLANAPRLDRSMGQSAKLPERFFELQDLLKKTSQELSDAGKANDMNASVEKFQTLITHCVACHASFKAQVQSGK
jgi:hypothetical protein